MTTDRPTYVCECREPATWFLRETGEGFNPKAFACCDRHVLNALNHMVPGRDNEQITVRRVQAALSG